MPKVFLINRNDYVNKLLADALVAAQHEVIIPKSDSRKDTFDALSQSEFIYLDLIRNAARSSAVLLFLKEIGLKKQAAVLLEGGASGGGGGEDEEGGKDAATIAAENAATIAAAAAVTEDVSAYPPSQTLFAISNVMTWGKTTKNSKTSMQESNYKKRKCSPKFKNTKLLETMVNSAQRDGLQTFVLASGVLFGKGEEDLHHLFMEAWMAEEKDAALPLLGDGRNVIPTIHVSDFVSICVAVLGNLPGMPYVVCVDNSKTTQKQLVSAISTALSTGGLKVIPKEDESVLMSSTKFGDVEVMLSDMKFDPEFTAQLGVEWKAPDGLVPVIATVEKEFISARNLTPLRVFLHGAPASGKTMYGELLSKHYVLPHIKIADVIAEATNGKDALAEKIEKALAAAQSALTAGGDKGGAAIASKPPAAAAAVSAAVKGGKPNPVAVSGKAPVSAPAGAKKDDKSKSVKNAPAQPRLPVDLLVEIVKRKLRSGVCRNKGFILDGFPRTFEEANLLWKKEVAPDAAEGEAVPEPEVDLGAEMGEDGKPKKKVEGPSKLEPSTRVSYVISLAIAEEEAMKRIMESKDDLVRESHNDEDGFRRRWHKFNVTNDPDSDLANSPLRVVDVEVCEITSELLGNVEKSLAVMSAYLEKGGKPVNFHPTPDEKEKKRKYFEDKKKADADRAQQEFEKRVIAEAEDRARREQAANNRRQSVLQEDAELIEAFSMPLRKYLMTHVVPALTEGLLDVCKAEPEDPVDHLAEYLFKCAIGSPSDGPNNVQSVNGQY